MYDNDYRSQLKWKTIYGLWFSYKERLDWPIQLASMNADWSVKDERHGGYDRTSPLGGTGSPSLEPNQRIAGSSNHLLELPILKT